jgi:hypothetical protein
MLRPRSFAILSVAIATACSSSSSWGPGIDDASVGGDGGIADDGAPRNRSDGGSKRGSTAGDATVSQGNVYCGGSSATECICSLQPANGLTEGASCSGATVGSPALCCAVAGWPASQPSGLVNAGCFCSKVFCQTSVFGDTCSCGFAAPSQGDKPTSSCTGKVCCRSRSNVAPICTCFDGLSQCPDADDEPVSSCTPSEVRCADQTPAVCH